MPSLSRAIAFVLIFCGIFEFVFTQSLANLVENGNFEELRGHFPAGVVVQRSTSSSGNHVTVVPHWDVVAQEGSPVEIISSLIWKSKTPASAKSLYALHLNSRAGPGGMETKVPLLSPFRPSSGVTKYGLSFDVAGNPLGGSAVRRLEVDVSPSECRPKRLAFSVPPGGPNAKRLDWKTVHLVFEVHGSVPAVMVKFRSLTPGSYGPIIDNVRLIRLQDEIGSRNLIDESVLEYLDSSCSGNYEEAHDKTGIEVLVERVWMATDTWIRQRFLRRTDW